MKNNRLNINKYPYLSSLFTKKYILKNIKEFYPNFLKLKNGEIDIIYHMVFYYMINNLNFTSLYNEDIYIKYWNNNKESIINYYNKNYTKSKKLYLSNAIYNHYNMNNLLYFEFNIISIIYKYNSKSILDIYYTTDKRLVGSIIKKVDYDLILNNKIKINNIKKNIIQNLNIKTNNYFIKSISDIKKLYDIIFIDTEHKDYKKQDLDKYINHTNKNGVIIYSYYKKIKDKIDTNYEYEILKFNQQKFLVYFKNKSLNNKELNIKKKKYIVLSEFIKNNTQIYFDNTWDKAKSINDKIKFIFLEGTYKKYEPLNNVKSDYKSMFIVNDNFKFTNKYKLNNYIKENNKKIYKKYFLEQLLIKDINNINTRKKIKKLFKKKNYWIVKPIYGFSGFGIKLFNDSSKCIKYLENFKNYKKKNKDKYWILEKYIENPLLIKKYNKKFHFRVNILITYINNKVNLYIFNHYLFLLSNKKFTLNNLNKDSHNTHYKSTEKKESGNYPEYFEKMYGKTIRLSIDKKIKELFTYIRSQISINCYKESKKCFRYFGADIMITDDFKIKLLEINGDPGNIFIVFTKYKDFFYKGMFDIILKNKVSKHFTECNDTIIKNEEKNNKTLLIYMSNKLNINKYPYFSNIYTKKEILKNIKQFYPNTLKLNNGEYDIISHMISFFAKINKLNFTSLYDEDIYVKYWDSNKKSIINYCKKNYTELNELNLSNAIYNHYNMNNLLYFEFNIISIIHKYNSKSILDIYYTTDKRLVGSIIKKVNYNLILNDRTKINNIIKNIIKNLNIKTDNNFIKSISNIKKLYDIIFIDTEHKDYKKPNLNFYLKYCNNNGVIIYSYYKRIKDKINKDFKYEILNFNQQKFLVYFKNRLLNNKKIKKNKKKYIVLSPHIQKDPQNYFDNKWNKAESINDNIKFIFIEGVYIKYKYIYDIKSDYKSLLLIDNNFEFTNKYILNNYIKKNNKTIYKKYLLEQFVIKNIHNTKTKKDIQKLFEKNKYWIAKPVPGAGGFGLKVFNNSLKCIQYLEKFKTDYRKTNKESYWILEKYIDNPLLIKKYNKKFHFRVNILITCINNEIKLYIFNHYDFKLAKDKFTLNSLNKNSHDTHSKSTEKKESGNYPEYFEEMYGKSKRLSIDKQIKELFTYFKLQVSVKCYKESKHCFKYYGADIMITNDFKIKLLEINEIAGSIFKIFTKYKDVFYQGMFDIVLKNKVSKHFTECNNIMRDGKKDNKTFLILSNNFNNDDFKKFLPNYSPTTINNSFIDFIYVDGVNRRNKKLYNIKSDFISLLNYTKHNFDNKDTLHKYVKKDNPKIYNKYFMEQYKINKNNIEKYSKLFKDNKIWITKPHPGGEGFGIKVVDTLDKLKKHIKTFKKKWKNEVNINSWILQKYIENPLLLNKKKFHMRIMFMLGNINGKNISRLFKTYGMIPSKKNFKLSEFDNKDIHNTHVKDLNKVKIFPQDFIKIYGETKMKSIKKQIKELYEYLIKIITYECYHETKNCYNFVGMDIMITDDYKVKCLELNMTPGLKHKTQTQKQKEIFIKNLLNFLNIL